MSDVLLTIQGGAYDLCNTYTYIALSAANLTVAGGSLQAVGSGYGIKTAGELSISGGEVTAAGSMYGVYCGTLTLTGGSLDAEAVGEIYC